MSRTQIVVKKSYQNIMLRLLLHNMVNFASVFLGQRRVEVGPMLTTRSIKVTRRCLRGGGGPRGHAHY